MTNPIAKALAKVAINMGYGKASDYKGCTIKDVLEKFASIAKDKGSSGGTPFVIEIEVDPTTGAASTTVTIEELEANLYNCVIHSVINGSMNYEPCIRPTELYDLDIEGTRIVALIAVSIDAEDERRIRTRQIVVGTMEDGTTVTAQYTSHVYYAVPDYMKSGISMGDKLTVTGTGQIGWWSSSEK